MQEENSKEISDNVALLMYFMGRGLFTEDDINYVCYHPRQEWIDQVNEWNSIYSKVYFQNIWDDRIGELVARYVMISADQAEWPDDELHIFVPGHNRWANSELRDIISRKINIFDEEKKYLYIYFIIKTRLPLNTSFDKLGVYEERSTFPRNKCNPEWTSTLFELADQKEEEAERLVSEIGIVQPYVTFANRDSSYLKKRYPQFDFGYHDFRDSKVSSFSQMASFFREKKIQTIRMGAVVSERADFDGCIDYANDHRNELLDIWLMQNCLMCVSDEGGINLLPSAMNIPLVLTNEVAFSLEGLGAIPRRQDTIFIIKKLYSEKEGRLLDLNEILHVEKIAGFNGSIYSQLGIRFIDNTAEEIADVAIEMYKGLFDKEEGYEQDKTLVKKFDDIVRNWQAASGYNMDAVYVGNIGSRFIRENDYLFEHHDSEYASL